MLADRAKRDYSYSSNELEKSKGSDLIQSRYHSSYLGIIHHSFRGKAGQSFPCSWYAASSPDKDIRQDCIVPSSAIYSMCNLSEVIEYHHPSALQALNLFFAH